MVYQTTFEFFKEIDFEIIPYGLTFNKPARTSRDVLTTRSILFIKVFFKENPSKFGIGECAPIFGLNPESKHDLESNINQVIKNIRLNKCFDSSQIHLPAIRFAFETAFIDLFSQKDRLLFGELPKDTKFPINGLVWMNEFETMWEEAFQKVEAGFQVIKLKIGGIDFEDELRLLSALREKYNDRILIRLDANGAFTRDEAMQKLKRLAEFDIHSIEQPIKAGQPIEMQALCSESPIAIALDEELIGVNNNEQKDELLETIRPPFIILKPTLHGGITGCEEWITLAEHKGVNWWATSALESNIGLNAIAQWLATKQISLPQGLGTGGLYSNNFHPAWDVSQGYLKFNNIQELNQDIILLK